MSNIIKASVVRADSMTSEIRQAIDQIDGFLTHEVQENPSFVFGELFLDLAAQVYEGARDHYERLASGSIKTKLGGRKSDQERWDRAVRERVHKREAEAKAAATAQASARPTSGRALNLHDPTQWAIAIDGIALLDEVVETIKEFVIVSDPAVYTVALWTVFDHLVDLFNIAPRLSIESPEPECGKTTLLDITGALTRRPLVCASISPAAIYRTIERYSPTLMIDELDAIFHPDAVSKEYASEVRGILNSGHRRSSANVVRLVKVGDDHEPRVFSTFTPIAHAMIGIPPSTLCSRAISIAMKRKLPGERVNDLDGPLRDINLARLETLAQKIARWATDNRDQVAHQRPIVPLHNRGADNWLPLLSVADAVGGSWPKRAREALAALNRVQTDNRTLGVQLLADIRDILTRQEYEKAEKIGSTVLCETLAAIEGSPWAAMPKTNKPITTTKLARMLRNFGAFVRHGEHGNEYVLKDFEDSFSRYLSTAQIQPFNPSESLERVAETADHQPFSPEGLEKSVSSTLSSQTEGLKGWNSKDEQAAGREGDPDNETAKVSDVAETEIDRQAAMDGWRPDQTSADDAASAATAYNAQREHSTVCPTCRTHGVTGCPTGRPLYDAWIATPLGAETLAAAMTAAEAALADAETKSAANEETDAPKPETRCRWCGRARLVDADGFCEARCRNLARTLGWKLKQSGDNRRDRDDDQG